jgi:DMSO/TMAO reductase YedYZ molybdopterin-dependent catalytic subunit
MRRRAFLQVLAAAAGGLGNAGCSRKQGAAEAGPPPSPFDGKAPDLILHTERPPNLEMPPRYLPYDLTPSEAMFVRWHESVVATSVDERTFRLRVGGLVDRPLDLSLADLRSRFEAVSIVAVNQCSGNSRSLFAPRVPGVQWARGAIGNARWTGARLKDVLAAAAPGAGAVEVTLAGLDHAPLDATPKFVKSLSMARASDPDVIVAWGMNDAPLPMLNGYPLRLVVPGWYSTYWIKSLSTIQVVDQPFDGYWMRKAYRIPAAADVNEAPDALAKDTVPISRMNVSSLVVTPEAGAGLRVGVAAPIEGLAWDGGSGVASVDVSTDGGTTWGRAQLDADLGRYSWRRFRASWTPSQAGAATIMARATSIAGESQGTTARWNRAGYMKNDCMRVDVRIA